MRKLSNLIASIEAKECLHWKDNQGVLPLASIVKAYALAYGSSESLWNEETRNRFSQTIREAIKESNANYHEQLEGGFRW